MVIFLKISIQTIFVTSFLSHFSVFSTEKNLYLIN